MTGAGSQFDPAIAEAFCRALDNGKVADPDNVTVDGLTNPEEWSPDSALHNAILAAGKR